MLADGHVRHAGMAGAHAGRRASRLIPAALWVGTFLFSVVTVAILNDHFGRISAARQIAVYNELPFRDFLDPGYFMTELATASLLWLLGDNLIGEVLLTTAAIATGTLLVFLLARRMVPVAPALAAAVMALLAAPRAYDYDKVLFYPLGVLACWRYAEQPTTRRLSVIAAVAVAAGLFRYDSAVYIGAMAIFTIAIVHAGAWKTLAARTVMLGAITALLAAPAVLFIQANGGIANALDQIVTYGQREAARSALSPPSFEPVDGVWWTVANASALLYYLLRGLPLAGAVLIAVRVLSAKDSSRLEVVRIGTLVIICALLDVFILRDPVGARVGGMAGPFAVLAVWLFDRAWQARHLAARAGGAAAAAVAVAAVLTVAQWPPRLSPARLSPPALLGGVRAWASSPPGEPALPNSHYAGMVKYLRECTEPRDRVVVGWFAPEVYFFAQRGFAGMPFILGEHWSEPRFQERAVRALASQSVPIVILRTDDEWFASRQPLIARFLDEHYVLAGTTDFGDVDVGPDGYTVMVRRDRVATHDHAITSLPCFSGRA